jgi:hypothetical protein
MKPVAKLAVAGALLLAAAAILFAQLGRGDGSRPTAKVEAGAFATERSPDESELPPTPAN